MVCQKVKIKNPAGLHLRPAGKLCDEAIKYKSKISFQRGTMITNVKSLLSVLAAGIKYNDEIEFVCEGEDEEEALAGIVSVIQNGVGESQEKRTIVWTIWMNWKQKQYTSCGRWQHSVKSR